MAMIPGEYAMPSSAVSRPVIRGFIDGPTSSITYVVHAGAGSACAIIDPVLGYDAKSGRTNTSAAEQVAEFVEQNDLRVQWILETHAHADHLTAAPHLKRRLGGQTGIGASITVVQKAFGKIFNLGPGLSTDGSQFDHLFVDGERFSIGDLEVTVIAVPGHTPACVAYKVGDAVFLGDTLFMPDVGTARTDFPGGDARTLYASIRRVLDLPPSTRLFACHDYPPANSRPIAFESTVLEQRTRNIHVRDDIKEADFIAMRMRRDATLEMPTLLLPAIQVNICAGEMPPKESNGVAYLKIPVDAL
jgi:glyoxylase-like metal-dependent hydrolase (beta-lactamase superfamily II)